MTFTNWQKISFIFDIYKTGRFTVEKNWEILKTYFQSEVPSVPSTQFLDQFVKRVRETGSLLDKITRSRSRPVRSAENIAAAAAQSVLKVVC